MTARRRLSSAMVKVATFELQHWHHTHELKSKYNISESSCHALSLSELTSLSADPTTSPINLESAQTYAPVKGSLTLRNNVANFYAGTGVNADNVLITPGAIQANFLVFYGLIERGDHVICQYPIFQALYSVPESLGATVTFWKAKPENEWRLDVDELEKLVTPSTKLIIINNPNNPTGSFIPKSDLERIVKIASAKGIYILCDEVFSPMYHSISKDDPELPPSGLELGYNRLIVTGSMSKVYALAGLRIGWIIAHDTGIIDKCLQGKEYTTITCSMIGDGIAAYALAKGTVDNILTRNLAIARKNVQILDDFIKKYPGKVDWVRPKASTTGFVRFFKGSEPVDDDKFCLDVLEKTGVYLAPGKRTFGNNQDYKGYVRIGYVCNTELLIKALEQLERYVEKEL